MCDDIYDSLLCIDKYLKNILLNTIKLWLFIIEKNILHIVKISIIIIKMRIINDNYMYD